MEILLGMILTFGIIFVFLLGMLIGGGIVAANYKKKLDPDGEA